MKRFVLGILIHLPTCAFTQDLSNTVIRFPIEIVFNIREVPVHLILDSIHGTPSGSHASLRIGFENPESGTWIWFKGDNIPFSNERLFSKFFEVALISEFEPGEINFLQKLLTEESLPGRYRWKCDCAQEIPKIVF